MNKSEMNFQQKIVGIIQNYKEYANFTGGVEDKTLISIAEKDLEVSLPEEYIWFLNNYGSGNIGSLNILGITKKGTSIFVKKTIERRKQGLPKNLVIIHDSDEWDDCIDTNNGNIVSWSIYDDDGVIFKYRNFYEYVLDYIQDAIDNL